MRRQFFEMLDGGSTEFNELVVAASAKIRRPNAPEGPGFSVEVERARPAAKARLLANPPPRSPPRKNSAKARRLIFSIAKV